MTQENGLTDEEKLHPLASHPADSSESDRVCFVAMPIREPGTEDYEHFLAIYDSVADVAQGAGYKPIRVDRNNRPGNIGRDIIVGLAEAPLVISDLTDINPNVFYELGVRHALRRYGTVLIMDKNKTTRIPFDLTQYRVVEYSGTVPGVRTLSRRLVEVLKALDDSRSQDSVPSDSPVHDWFPELPSNLITEGRQAQEADLRRDITDLRRQVEFYKQRLRGTNLDSVDVGEQNLDALLRQLRQAEAERRLPSQVLQEGLAAASTGNLRGFISAVEKFAAGNLLDPMATLRFSRWADALGLEDLAISILEKAVRLNGDVDLERSLFFRLSQSPDPGHRARAKDQLSSELGITWDGDTPNLTPSSAPKGSELGLFLGILHKEGRDEMGLRLLKQALRPLQSVVCSQILVSFHQQTLSGQLNAKVQILTVKTLH